MQDLITYAHDTSAHECGHVVVLFKEGRFVDLNFLPHKEALNGSKGVFEVNTGIALGEQDCVALAAGMAGELVDRGEYDSEHVRDDEQQIQRLVGKTLKDFATQAKNVIEQNLCFFSLLNTEVRKRIIELLLGLGGLDWDKLPSKIPVITLAEVEQIYQRARSEENDDSVKVPIPPREA